MKPSRLSPETLIAVLVVFALITITKSENGKVKRQVNKGPFNNGRSSSYNNNYNNNNGQANVRVSAFTNVPDNWDRQPSKAQTYKY
jgi:hypothetical protein